MPIDKVVPSFDEAVADIPDGATLMIDGFAGPGGTPQNLIRALRDQGARDLTIVSNTAGLASVIGFGTIPGDRPIDIGILVDNEQVKKVIASFPVSPSPSRPTSFERAYLEGKVELEVVFDGREHLMEHALTADFALLKAHQADPLGNVVYRGTSRNFNAVMAASARTTVVEVDEIVQVGDLDPASVTTPAIYVDRVAVIPA